MYLLEPQRTQFDLCWRMFGIDVRVNPMFWLLSAILGFSVLQDGIGFFLVWIACVFFSILIHELGHVFAFQICGTDAHIVLYSFGGLAIPYRPLYNRWQRIAVSFAGPLAQFMILVIIAIVLATTDVTRLETICSRILSIVGVHWGEFRPLHLHPLVEAALMDLVVINLLWALFNLLPIIPLDGGQISRDFLDGVMPDGQGVRLALGISLVLAGVLAVNSIAAANGSPLIPFFPFGGTYTALMFGMLAVQSFQMLQQERNPPWRREF